MFMLSKLNFATTTLMVLISLAFLPAIATAQDSPYAPKQVPRSTLIDMGDFSSSPIKLPWTAVSVTTASNKNGSLNFEHLINESYPNVMEQFRSYYNSNKPIVTLNEGAVRYSKVRELNVRGFDHNETLSNIILGAETLPRHFFVTIEPYGNQTKIVIINSTHTMEFSGVMPSRAPLRPAGAKPIAFRWN